MKLKHIVKPIVKHTYTHATEEAATKASQMHEQGKYLEYTFHSIREKNVSTTVPVPGYRYPCHKPP